MIIPNMSLASIEKSKMLNNKHHIPIRNQKAKRRIPKKQRYPLAFHAQSKKKIVIAEPGSRTLFVGKLLQQK